MGLYALALLASVILVVHTVPRPQTASSLAVGEVQRYPTTEYLEQSRLDIEGAIMRGLAALCAEACESRDATCLRPPPERVPIAVEPFN